MHRAVFALSLLTASALCHALGAEDTEFYGNLPGGLLLKLRLTSDPQVWSKQNFIYGTSGTKLALCWSERVKEVRKSFVCTTTKGTAPTLVYALFGSPEHQANFSDQTPQGKEYRAIASKARLGDGTKQGDGTLAAIYVCKVGCSADTPTHLYEVAKYD